MRKVGALVLGAIAMGVVYALGVMYCQHLVRVSGRSPESYLWLAFLIFAPLACLVGGCVAGLVAGPPARRPVLEAVFSSPGFYMGLSGLLPALANGAFNFAVSLILPVFLWTAASAGGFLLVQAQRRRTAARRGEA